MDLCIILLCWPLLVVLPRLKHRTHISDLLVHVLNTHFHLAKERCAFLLDQSYLIFKKGVQMTFRIIEPL